ncbi:coiled-coil domain-containing protein 113 isoform X5 [Peromyscus californicus insignis]|uniref:coiled-coil domain-containing protein 113 isoform X5 n=1 Tax=Peromyscus californicus insignis TaxID=564181 RepID=UPI0022A67BF6|nr:coiled-coil domain-containing protein 113 isoform X5 [Peromyscus californicus insignis]
MAEEESESTATDSQTEESGELPVIQLCGLVEELSYGNSALRTETEMFEKYYFRLEPRDYRTPRLSELKISSAEFSQFRSRRKSKARLGDRAGLTVDQKLELVQKELEDTREEIRHMRANAERDLQYHEAIIEEVDIRWTEVQRAVHDFEKDIMKTISKKKGSILATQKVMKYIEDMNRRRDNMKDKLCLKNVSLKVQKKKMLLQLRQNKLHRAMDIYNNLDKEILQRNELLGKIEKETIQAEEDRAKAHALNNKLRKQLAEFRAPQVMMYVKEKILNGELEKTIRMWERKVEIAEMSLKGYRKAWNKMKTSDEQLQTVGSPGK